MKYLVDANVLSEPTRPQPQAAAIEWLRRHQPDLVVTPVVLGEIEYGILALTPGRRRQRLHDWFANAVRRLRVLDLDADTGSIWAALLARLKQRGRAMPVRDSLIAASALQHGLTIATHNVADFQYAGVKLVDPFTA